MNNISTNNKIILLGEKNAGKTSIFSMIFTNIYPIETNYFESTKSISLNQIIFSGGEIIEFDDCGFEENKEDDYKDNKDSKDSKDISKDNKDNEEYYYLKETIFENVSTLVFVVNAEPFKADTEPYFPYINNNNYIYTENSNNYDSLIKIKKELFFEKVINILNERSPKANIVVLIHKMDSILEANMFDIYEEKKQELILKFSKLNNKNNNIINIKFFATSIWDGSLYEPWAEIMSNMVKNKSKLEKGLNFLLKACDVDEIFLFEKNTLLCICSVDRGRKNYKEIRTKKISFLIKKINQALRRNKVGFSFIKLKLYNIMVYIEELTKYNYIMFLSQNPKINYEFLSLNISILRESFEKSLNRQKT